ncbi:MAG: cytochrome-c peroxidase [Gammaproteobacteria bacterium]|nr:cytochrome-c peroxidase [Gammaproteobacteria bacterium]|tara:strand:+ start:3547 stop:4722 length:1176 start_codon:yes stop_codon:yes gene_type:complete
MSFDFFKIIIIFFCLCLFVSACDKNPFQGSEWSKDEITIIKSLWLESLPKLPDDPTNAVADNELAAEFGKNLFFDTRFSANGKISCATCHQVERQFTDGLKKALAIGISNRNTPSIVGSQYSPWQYWDGRRDSQWAQSLAPLENSHEHGTNRKQVINIISKDSEYKKTYEKLFGPLKNIERFNNIELNTAFANVGKSIAAFERTILPTSSRFDKYIANLDKKDVNLPRKILNKDEKSGLRLFIGKAKCTQCHNGPLFTNNEFHNTGLINHPGDLPDKGRINGVREVLDSEFNCRSIYSDDPVRKCPELDFIRTGSELIGAVKTPSLRNLEHTAPYMHKGQLQTIAEVLDHYNRAPDAMIGHNEAEPLGLNSIELRQIEAFLDTLRAPVSFK